MIHYDILSLSLMYVSIVIPLLFSTLLLSRRHAMKFATAIGVGGFLTIHEYGIPFYIDGYEHLLEDRSVYHKVITAKTIHTLEPCYEDVRLRKHMFPSAKLMYERIMKEKRAWEEQKERELILQGLSTSSDAIRQGAKHTNQWSKKFKVEVDEDKANNESNGDEEEAELEAQLDAMKQKKRQSFLYNYMDDALDDARWKRVENILNEKYDDECSEEELDEKKKKEKEDRESLKELEENRKKEEDQQDQQDQQN